jgi:hypothetical protein
MPSKRDVAFLLADGGMEQVVTGFLGWDGSGFIGAWAAAIRLRSARGHHRLSYQGLGRLSERARVAAAI